MRLFSASPPGCHSDDSNSFNLIEGMKSASLWCDAQRYTNQPGDAVTHLVLAQLELYQTFIKGWPKLVDNCKIIDTDDKKVVLACN